MEGISQGKEATTGAQVTDWCKHCDDAHRPWCWMAYATASVSFWCEKCRADHDLPAVKTPWTVNGADEWYWQARCPNCSSKLIRYGDAKNDPYFVQSDLKRKDAYELRKELLQPGQDGFATLYPEAQRKLEETREKVAVKKEKKKKVLAEKYKKVMEQHGFRRDKTAQKLKELYLGDN